MPEEQTQPVIIVVKISIAGSESSYLVGKAAFWAALQKSKRHTNSESSSDDELEARFERRFGMKLREMLIDFIAEPYIRIERRYTRSDQGGHAVSDPQPVQINDNLRKIFFKARIRSYSSLNFDLEIAGLKSLSEVLGADFDLLRMFLDVYIPKAFESTFDHWNFSTTAEVVFPTAFRAEFCSRVAQNPVPRQHSNSSQKTFTDRAAWVWILSNTSLVIPVILALAVIYIHMKTLDEQRLALDQRFADVQRKEENAYRLLVEHYEKISNQMLEVAQLPKRDDPKRDK